MARRKQAEVRRAGGQRSYSGEDRRSVRPRHNDGRGLYCGMMCGIDNPQLCEPLKSL